MSRKISDLQVVDLHSSFDILQETYGDKSLNAIFGAGQIRKPKLALVFMNPTARNCGAYPTWKGIRALWVGTTQVWGLLQDLGVVSSETYKAIKLYKSNWPESFAYDVYKEVAANGYYITNLAKCTQLDARPLGNDVFKKYLKLFWQEVNAVSASKIVTFGAQVSSLVLERAISMQEFHGQVVKYNGFSVMPTYYPVGQGRRNAPYMIADVVKFTSQS